MGNFDSECPKVRPRQKRNETVISLGELKTRVTKTTLYLYLLLVEFPPKSPTRHAITQVYGRRNSGYKLSVVLEPFPFLYSCSPEVTLICSLQLTRRNRQRLRVNKYSYYISNDEFCLQCL